MFLVYFPCCFQNEPQLGHCRWLIPSAPTRDSSKACFVFGSWNVSSNTSTYNLLCYYIALAIKNWPIPISYSYHEENINTGVCVCRVFLQHSSYQWPRVVCGTDKSNMIRLRISYKSVFPVSNTDIKLHARTNTATCTHWVQVVWYPILRQNSAWF